MNKIKVGNIILILIVFILAVNIIRLTGIEGLTPGGRFHGIETSEGSKCVFHNAGELNEIPIDLCCFELQKQVTCEYLDGEFEARCYISETSERYYLVNNKALSYCKSEGYDLQVG